MASTMLPPLSPISRYINTSTLTCYFIAVWELEIPIDKPATVEVIENCFKPLNKRLSSIIVTDKKGVPRWKQVDCRPEDHLVIPTFPSGLSAEEYDLKLEEYISDIYMEPLPETHSPWQAHLFMYPTSNAACTMLLKVNHALGDGYSFIGALLNVFKRADDPSLPLKLPTASSRIVTSNYSRMSNFVARWINTCIDITRNIRLIHFQDDDTVVRSKTPRVEYTPVDVRSVIISLDQIKEVKNITGATVNDVTTGLIAFALQLYMKRKGQVSGKTHSTAMVCINLRMYKGFKTLEDMLKANLWGNQFGFLNVSLPSFSDVDNIDPLNYIFKTKKELRRRMNSLSCYFSSKILNAIAKLKGAETAAGFVHSSLRNTSIMISNMCGPTDKASIAGRPLKSLYFTVPGIPQSLVFTIISYNGKLRVVVSSERGYIDSPLLLSCLREAFTKIYKAAIGDHPVKIEINSCI